MHYFVVENRSQIGMDAGLPDEGLAVYHCDTLGSNEWQDGTATRHYQCALLQADGHLDLENGRNRGDAGDLFPETSGIVLSDATTPSTRLWDDSDSGLVISTLGEPGAVIGFSVGRPKKSPVFSQEVTPDALIPDDNEVGIRSAIHVPESGTIDSIRVGVDVIHTWIGDLVIELEPPGQSPIRLHDREGGSANDISRDYDMDVLPDLKPLQGAAMKGDWRLHVSDHAGRDVGRLNRWSLEIGYTPAAELFSGAAAPNLAIPDNDATGIRSSIPVDRQGSLEAIEVGVRIDHSYIGDLRVDLVAPSGLSATLHLREGGSTNNLHRTYDRSSTLGLADLLGQEIQGDWELRVQDRAWIDTGRLVEWSLELQYS